MRRDGARAGDRTRARAPWRRPPLSRREATLLAREALRGWRFCAARDSAWPRARATARRPSGATRAVPSWPSKHAACREGWRGLLAVVAVVAAGSWRRARGRQGASPAPRRLRRP
jgi:hypothetical protein